MCPKMCHTVATWHLGGLGKSGVNILKVKYKFDSTKRCKGSIRHCVMFGCCDVAVLGKKTLNTMRLMNNILKKKSGYYLASTIVALYQFLSLTSV